LKQQLLFVGNTFRLNHSFERYIIRHVKSKVANIDAISYFNESDKQLFLDLEKMLQSHTNILIVTTQNSFTVVGKFLSTITGDNLTLIEGMLIPSQTISYEKESYLISHNNLKINVILAKENSVLPAILFEDANPTHLLHIFEESMHTLQEQLKPLALSHEVRLSFSQIVDGWIQVYVQSNRFGNIERFLTVAENLYTNRSISTSNIINYIISKLQSHHKKVTFAESCTGGLLSYLFTRKSGASDIFDGSLITYSNVLKANWLAVDEETLIQYGAVSSEVVKEMSEGALDVSHADYALSVSGIAGPNGGTKEKPVGSVYISAHSKSQNKVEYLSFQGDRNYVQEQSAFYAVKMLLQIDKKLFFNNIPKTLDK